MCILYDEYHYTFCHHLTNAAALFDIDYCNAPNGVPFTRPQTPGKCPTRFCDEEKWEVNILDRETFCPDCVQTILNEQRQSHSITNQLDLRGEMHAPEVLGLEKKFDGVEYVYACGHGFVAYEPASLQHCFEPGTPRQVEHNVRAWESHRGARLDAVKVKNLVLGTYKYGGKVCVECRRRWARREEAGRRERASATGFRRRKPLGLRVETFGGRSWCDKCWRPVAHCACCQKIKAVRGSDMEEKTREEQKEEVEEVAVGEMRQWTWQKGARADLVGLARSVEFEEEMRTMRRQVRELEEILLAADE